MSGFARGLCKEACRRVFSASLHPFWPGINRPESVDGGN